MKYDAEHYHNHSAVQLGLAGEILESLPFTGAERVLDIGCGEGKITAALAGRLPNGDVTGVDISEEMIAYAAAHYAAPNLTFKRGDATALPFVEPFDQILSFSCFHWLESQERAFLEVVRLLKPGGHASILTFPRDSLYADFLDAVTARAPFRAYEKPCHNLYIHEYEALFKKLPLAKWQIERTDRVAEYATPADLQNYILGWLPSLIDLPPALTEPFLEAAVEEAAAFRIDRGDEKLYVPYTTIHIALVSEAERGTAGAPAAEKT